MQAWGIQHIFSGLFDKRWPEELYNFIVSKWHHVHVYDAPSEFFIYCLWALDCWSHKSMYSKNAQ